MADQAFAPATGTEIAIIGMSGRFPGANNLAAFGQNLCAGVESITFFSEHELAAAGINPALLADPSYVKAAPMIDDIELFDAAFFGINHREAEVMDPQQRILLECAWEALEHAGYSPESYPGAIAVYAGAAMNPGWLFALYSNAHLLETVGSFQAMLGNDRDYLTTHISYKLNLRGPSINVQTACSTSLVATHLACQSLLNGECDLALAGGVSINRLQKEGYRYRVGGIVSPDGHCRAFDADGQGTVFGDGVGLVVLKPLADALADGDTIHAVIKGSALNNDGALKIGFTAPSVEGQAEVIAEALAVAGVAPETVTYIETHGTATPLGDPIEIAALTRAFRAGTQKKGFCALGSVKTNVGHLNTAAGVTGLLKAVIGLERKLLLPTLNFRSPNPKIDFANSPFYVNTELADWPANGSPRRAGVSSFGVGGTNVHMILEEAPPLAPAEPLWPWQVLPISARSSAALETATANLVADLKAHPERELADVAYTLQVGRSAFEHRRMLVCADLRDAIRALDPPDPKRVAANVVVPGHRPVVFMFSGQGAQYAQMAAGLYQLAPVFREQLDRCAELLVPQLGRDLREIIYPRDEGSSMNDERRTTKGDTTDSSCVLRPASELLNQTQYAQPALFAIAYALAQLWMSWGIVPEALIGHSVGEYVAACLAGVFTLEDALALVADRARMVQSMPAGAMLAVALPEQQIRPLLGPQLALAAINGPALCAIAGPASALERLHSHLAETGVECRRLHTSHAFHSAMLDPIVEPFRERVRQIDLRPPRIPYLSNLTGGWISAAEATDPAYWAAHLRQPVRFAAGIAELLAEPERVLLEVGPGQTLCTFARQQAEPRGTLVLASLRHPQDQQPDAAFVLTTAGRLWLAGAPLDWAALHAHEYLHRIPLPTYPFERRRYWIEAPKWQQLPQSPAAFGEPAADAPPDAPALTLHPRSTLLQTYVAPSNELERRIAASWQDLLGVEQIGVHDNFFELGGHSLLATRIVARLREAFAIEVPLPTFFAALTIAELAEAIEALVIEKIETLPEDEAQRLVENLLS
jgi:acyl transferase domain-containing protein